MWINRWEWTQSVKIFVSYGHVGEGATEASMEVMHGPNSRNSHLARLTLLPLPLDVQRGNNRDQS